MPLEQNKMQLILQELVRRTNDELMRLRNVEDRTANLEERLATLESTSMQRTKKLNEKFTEMDIRIKDIADEVARIKNIVEKLGKQLSNVALRRDVKELERMFDLLSPVRQEYVTREEAH
jgi:predicted  nucleic acid-binding Zn-ribbon protein